MMKQPTAMRLVLVAAACAVQAGALWAQTSAPDPAELPPEGYDEAQYVDSAGCVFIRAGIDDQITWVPRLTRAREPVCGFVPSIAAHRSAAAAPATSAPRPEVELIEMPVATTARRSKPSVAPRAVAPAAESKAGTVVTAKTAASKGVSDTARVLPRHVYEARSSRPQVKVPRGYRPAWDDDRLNSRRAEQTLRGRASMREIWTDTVPRRLID